MFRNLFGVRSENEDSNQIIANLLTTMMQESLENVQSAGISQHAMEQLRARATTVEASETPSQCSICLENIYEGEQSVQLECQHIFHLPCIERWCTSHNSCPMCRRRIDEEQQQQPAPPQVQRIILNNITTVQITFHLHENAYTTYWYSYNTIVDVFLHLSQMQDRNTRMMLQINNKMFKTTESYEYLSQTLTQHGIIGRVDAYVHFLH